MPMGKMSREGFGDLHIVPKQCPIARFAERYISRRCLHVNLMLKCQKALTWNGCSSTADHKLFCKSHFLLYPKSIPVWVLQNGYQRCPECGIPTKLICAFC